MSSDLERRMAELLAYMKIAARLEKWNAILGLFTCGFMLFVTFGFALLLYHLHGRGML